MSNTITEAKVSVTAHHDMMHALGEGTLGRAFREFSLDNPKGTIRVVRIALLFWVVSEYNPQYRTEKGMSTHTCDLVGVGAYAHNFTEIVSEMAEPYLPLMMGPSLQNVYMLNAWEWFAANVTKTA